MTQPHNFSEIQRAERYCRDVVEAMLRYRGYLPQRPGRCDRVDEARDDIHAELGGSRGPEVPDMYSRGFCQDHPAEDVARRIQNLIWDRPPDL